MRKVLKGIGLGISTMLGLLACFIAILAIYNNRAITQEKPLLEKSYGKMIEVDHKEMCVQIEGKGDEVLIISPGFGSISPILEMKALVNQLKTEYTVIVVEPFGYGMSDQTDKIRTIENRTQELHTAIQKLGYKKYWMMGHSISGVYDLYYANQYPDEVIGYVSIDGAVPKQNLEEEGSVLQYQLLNLLNKTGVYRFLAEHDSEGIVPNIDGVQLTLEEMKQYKALAYLNFMNENIIDEFKQSKENFYKTSNLTFPAQCPVLTFLSSENCNSTPNWQELHEEIVTMKTQGQCIVLDGGHYLHYEYGKEIAKQFSMWRELNRI